MLQVEFDQNLLKFEISYILKLTFKQQNLYIFGISEQFAIKKSTIYRATSIVDLHMRIFKFQGFGATDKPEKKLSTQKLILHLTTAS
jgi:hypothetical protein